MMIKYFNSLCSRAALTARNPVRWLIGTGIIAIAAIVIATAMAISGFRDHALASTERELENTLVLLTRHFDQEFEDLQRIQKNIDVYLQITGTASAEDFARRMASLQTYKILQAMVSNTSTGTINIISADGRLINRTGAWPATEVYLGDRAYFLKLKNNSPDADEEIVEPLVSRVTGGWLTTFARRLSGPNGEFLGVVSRHVNPEQFERFFASISLGKSATISMLHSNRMLMARHPHANELIGKTFPSNGVFDRLQRTAPSTLITVSPIDGLRRITSVYQLHKFPVVLVATVSVENALAQWRTQTRLIIGAAALAALIVGGLLFLITRQVTRQHRAAKQRLMLEMNRLDTAINNMPQGLMLFDAEARAVVVSKSYLSMYRVSADVIRPGCTLHDAMTQHKADGSFEGDVDAYCSRILQSIKSSHSVTVSVPDGRVIHMQSEPIADGGWVVTHEDITERHRVEERIAYLAHYDSLTDLPNRTLFRELLGKELGWTARGRGCAVLYIDMDEFKAINDSLGHSVGDALLRAVAQRLKSCVRSCDVVARLGGDEFAIVQIDLKSRDEVIDLVGRVHTAIRAPFECLGHSLFTDVSIGIAMAPHDGEDLDTLLKSADLAMYGAKADGRRTHRFFEPGMNARVQAQRLLEHDLRHASADGQFEAGGFEVFYQPLLRLDDDTISGCEALLRWRHPVRGMISPAEFIPAAESIGVINQLGEWVLSTACAEAAIWPGDIKIAVNVSPVQFRSPTLALKVAAALEGSGLPPTRLELEITEAVLIRDDDAALAILHQLRGLGVRIALDDFGTGYSSLSYLQRFPFDKIKIDRCFITDITEPNGSSAIVQAVVNIAAARHMTTTAEGVETERQKEILRSLGCIEMQGWLFSAAKPAAEVRALIAAHRGNERAA